MRLTLFNATVVQVLLYGDGGGTISLSPWNETKKIQKTFLKLGG